MCAFEEQNQNMRYSREDNRRSPLVNFLILKKQNNFMCMSVLPICMSLPRMHPYALRDKKRASEPLNLEL